jgi:threonine synthase
VKYVSTRGAAPVLEFSDVLLEGLARDGGLYVPEKLRKLPYDMPESYVDVAAIVTGVDADVLAEAYATFDHPDVCPVVQLDDHLWVQELWHGPTLAFKDAASAARSSSPRRATPARPRSLRASDERTSTSSCSTRPGA